VSDQPESFLDELWFEARMLTTNSKTTDSINTQERLLQIQGSKMLAVLFKALPKVIVIGSSVENLIVQVMNQLAKAGYYLP
jgi:hypothetical protein